MQRFSHKEVIIIVLFFALYMLGCHFLISSGGSEPKQEGRDGVMAEIQTERKEETTPIGTR